MVDDKLGISTKAQTAKEIVVSVDQQYGVSETVMAKANELDSSYQISQKAQSLDSAMGISDNVNKAREAVSKVVNPPVMQAQGFLADKEVTVSVWNDKLEYKGEDGAA